MLKIIKEIYSWLWFTIRGFPTVDELIKDD